MDIPIFFALGFAPGIFWLWYFYRKDKYEPEPQRLVIRTSLLGIAIAIPVVLVELPFVETVFFVTVIVAPIVEECAKFGVVRLSMFNHKEFNEPMDGIVYAAAAALGFASIENVGYIADQYIEGGTGVAAATFIMRAFLSVPGHVLFSTLWGEALGRSKFAEPSARRAMVAKGLALAILAHAAFNFVLTSGFSMLALVFLIPGLWRMFNKNVAALSRQSPFQQYGASSLDEKAKEFFNPSIVSAVHTAEEFLLPEVMECPTCRQPLVLGSAERKRGAFICQHCHGFYQQMPRQFAQPTHPSASTSATAQQYFHSSSSTADVIVSNFPPLPAHVSCMRCGVLLDLTPQEQIARKFVCPNCNVANDARAARYVANIFREKETRWVAPYRLKPFVVCQKCEGEVILDNRERAEGIFVCPFCQRRSEYESVESASSLTQFYLAQEPICPECGTINTLDQWQRRKTLFTCSGCLQVIQLVEE